MSSVRSRCLRRFSVTGPITTARSASSMLSVPSRNIENTPSMLFLAFSRGIGDRVGPESARNASAAALRLGACSACATTASRVSRAPGSRAAKQSGSRLKVMWLSGQYQRAMRVPRGALGV